MEAAVANLIEPGEKILIINTGIWGVRAAELSSRYAGLLILWEVLEPTKGCNCVVKRLIAAASTMQRLC
jgi:aspartate aminotransferase-like enzyme